MAEAVAWCGPRASASDPNSSLRSAALAPGNLLSPLGDTASPDLGKPSLEDWKAVGQASKKHPDLRALPAIECLRYLAETQEGTTASVEKWKQSSRWYLDRQAARSAFFAREDAERARMVDSLCEKRAALLTSPVDADLPQSDILAGGRLLVATLVTVLDGASEVESLSFLDIEDLPPWDTWIAYAPMIGGKSHPQVISWVPPSFLQLAEAGIRVNCVECLRWATPEDLQLNAQR